MNSESNALKRIRRDLQKLAKEDDPGIVVNQDEGNMFHMTAMIMGPQKTIWEDGVFQLKLTFTNEYPIKCPNVVFKSKMYHPNIYPDGRICLDLLNNQWSPNYDIMAIMVSIRSLLNSPNPNSPANNEACLTYKNSPFQYERRVKEIVKLSQQEDQDE